MSGHLALIFMPTFVGGLLVGHLIVRLAWWTHDRHRRRHEAAMAAIWITMNQQVRDNLEWLRGHDG